MLSFVYIILICIVNLKTISVSASLNTGGITINTSKGKTEQHLNHDSKIVLGIHGYEYCHNNQFC